MTLVWGDVVRERLIRAGWQPARRVVVPAAVPVEHPAQDVLRELGGLEVAPSDQGEDAPATGVAFGYRPSLETEAWSGEIGSVLIAVGSCHDSYGEVWVDQRGRCFEFTDVDGGLYFMGQSVDEGLRSLVLGRRGRPLLKRGCERVKAYGVEYERGDPEIYEPE